MKINKKLKINEKYNHKIKSTFHISNKKKTHRRSLPGRTIVGPAKPMPRLTDKVSLERYLTLPPDAIQ